MYCTGGVIEHLPWGGMVVEGMAVVMVSVIGAPVMKKVKVFNINSFQRTACG